MTDASNPFAVQADVRDPWKRYLDSLVPLRASLHRYCCRLTGNVWDGEDLVQDTLVRVFSLLGKVSDNLENPRGYLIRTATNLWIDRVRRSAREQAILQLEAAEDQAVHMPERADAKPAAAAFFKALHPQERAALVMKEVLDFSLDETASILKTSTGAVKSALHRARDRLAERRPQAGFDTPPRDLVERFMIALRDSDTDGLKAICATDLHVELVGGAELHTFEKSKTFFTHAHFVMPELGFGDNPNWRLADYEGEPVVLGFRTMAGVEGLNEIHRLEVVDGKIARIRCYCFCPDTLKAVAVDLGRRALDRPHRSPG